jgi:phage portal protein BeeE
VEPAGHGVAEQDGFHGNPVGYRAVKMIAEAAAALPVICQDAQRRYDTHPALALLGRPNAAQGRADLMEAAYVQLLLSGNAYLEACWRMRAGRWSCMCCARTG